MSQRQITGCTGPASLEALRRKDFYLRGYQAALQRYRDMELLMREWVRVSKHVEQVRGLRERSIECLARHKTNTLQKKTSKHRDDDLS